MAFSAYIKAAGRLCIAAIACVSTASCDSTIYDYEGDCSVTYRAAFRYDRNMKWADAFANEVSSVHLYAFDKSGTLVWQQSERCDAPENGSYTMPLDLPPGDYRIVAWCGLDNGDDKSAETFTVPEVEVGKTVIEDLQCTMRRSHDAEGLAFTSDKLKPLFHGMLDVSLPDASYTGGDYTYTVDLTKDTNHVRVILQQLSGKPVNVDDFEFFIDVENGLMGYDNSLLPDENIRYNAYHTGAGTAGLGIDDYPEPNSGKPVQTASRDITAVSVAIADFSLARLTERNKAYLTVRNVADGHTSARIPLTDYALLLKDGYDREMTPQEYLDRQDDYTLTLFLDENKDWIGTSIIINSWKIVLDDVEFE